MKRSHIVVLVVIACLIGALMVTLLDASEYATFALAQKQKPEKVTVVGTLDLDQPISFDPKNSMLQFTAVDRSGGRSVVLYNQPKPTDFERSEEITLTGHATDSLFIATEILMKCPSKYANSDGPVSAAAL